MFSFLLNYGSLDYGVQLSNSEWIPLIIYFTVGSFLLLISLNSSAKKLQPDLVQPPLSSIGLNLSSKIVESIYLSSFGLSPLSKGLPRLILL